MALAWYYPVRFNATGLGSDGAQFSMNVQPANVTVPTSDMYHTSLVTVNFTNKHGISGARDVHVVASTIPAISVQTEESLILWDTYCYDPATEDLITLKRLQQPQAALDTLIEFECQSKPVISLVDKTPSHEKDDVAIMVQWANSLAAVDYKQHPLGMHITRHWLERYSRHMLFEQMSEKSWIREQELDLVEQEALESRLCRGLGFEDQTLLNKKWPGIFHGF